MHYIMKHGNHYPMLTRRVAGLRVDDSKSVKWKS